MTELNQITVQFLKNLTILIKITIKLKLKVILSFFQQLESEDNKDNIYEYSESSNGNNDSNINDDKEISKLYDA
ncbi:4883_t:CDS:2 [Funneliformis geosporum]|uniref:4883_t:CDS:1 n=1 Tax=Funneliformis geosporum TaxID=1117311 RepID=A0A9W4WVE4_9GLOM|nr:4883_t:CDS:2 [Funneliformis geosporum]